MQHTPLSARTNTPASRIQLFESFPFLIVAVKPAEVNPVPVALTLLGASFATYFNKPSYKAKPRDYGLNLIIDKGLGLSHCEDLLNLAGDYIDYIKLGFGTGMLYKKEYLIKKINLIKST